MNLKYREKNLKMDRLIFVAILILSIFSVYVNALIIGGREGGYHNGTIDEVRIYNRSLSSEEIKQQYYSNLYKYETNKWNFYTNQSNLTYGTYTYQGCAKDEAGNENCTDLRYLEITSAVDITAPTILVQSPTNITYSTSTIWFNATPNETISTWIINYNGTNRTITINNSVDVENGQFQLYVYANDTSNNWGVNDSVYFAVDATAPSISGETKSPEPSYNDDDVTLNATISDAEANLQTVWISGNWTGSWENITVTTHNGDIYYYTVLSGNFSNQEAVGWRYYANDSAGNSQNGSLQLFTVQNRVPSNVSLLEPPNATITAENTTFFNWTNATDADGDSITYILQVDNNSDFSSLEIEKTGLTDSNYTLTNAEALPEDVYYWRIYSNDSYAVNVSAVWQFEINPFQAVGVSMSNKLTIGINWTITSLPIYNLSANGNNGTGITEYDVIVSATGTTVDLYVKADGNLITSGGDLLVLGNETLSYNSTNNTVPSVQKYKLTTSYSSNKIGSNLPDGSTVYLKFFLSAPGSQPPGTYRNNVTVKAVPFGGVP